MKIFEELDINPEKRELISLVGAGGKTTTMFTLAQELKTMGKSVLVTTTTAIYRPTPSQYDNIIIGDVLLMDALIENSPSATLTLTGIVVFGSKVSSEGKLLGLDSLYIDKIFEKNIFDFILVESDGSKRKPIKAPAQHEPIIPKLSTKVIGLIGMDALGKKINNENVHRPEIFCSLTNGNLNDNIDEEKIYKLIKSQNGLFKSTPIKSEKYLILNKVESVNDIMVVEKIKKKASLDNLGINKIIISVRNGELNNA